MKKIAFLTTIFPIKDEYVYNFFDSLNNQTFKNFEVVVVNDKYKNFEKIKRKYTNLNIIEIDGNKTPAKNREKGINFCIEKGYDIIIFGDIDDYFASNRVEKSIEKLKNYDIVVNDVSLFNEKGVYEKKYFSNRIKNNTIIDFEFIKNKNIFGLSNTAIKLKNMEKIDIPDAITAVDWYIFSWLLLNNKTAVFINNTVTYYRQHQNNTVGLNKNRESIERIKKIKLEHYKFLTKLNDDFEEEIKKLENLQFNKLKKINYPLWWEIM
jgi:hypothetical protein